MPDDLDRLQELELMDNEGAVRAAIKPIAAGEPGECEHCGESSPRLVRGACAPCRDEMGLP